MKKKRLDILLVDRDLVPSRSRAQARIMAGDVYVQGQRCDKAGTRFADDVAIELRGDVAEMGASRSDAAPRVAVPIRGASR